MPSGGVHPIAYDKHHQEVSLEDEMEALLASFEAPDNTEQIAEVANEPTESQLSNEDMLKDIDRLLSREIAVAESEKDAAFVEKSLAEILLLLHDDLPENTEALQHSLTEFNGAYDFLNMLLSFQSRIIYVPNHEVVRTKRFQKLVSQRIVAIGRALRMRAAEFDKETELKS